MANNPKFSTGLRNAMLDGTDMTAMFDGANASLHIFSGTQPTDADTTEGAGTVLATIDLPAANAFDTTAASGSLPKSATVWEDTSADATGTAAWFRLYKDDTATGASSTEIRIDGTVGVGASFDLDISTTAIVTADPVTVDTFSIDLLA